MRIKVVDYVGNPGGGIRFSSEVLRGLSEIADDLSFELVSHGDALANYRTAVADIPRLTLTERWPSGARLHALVRGLPSGLRLLRAVGWLGFHFTVASDVLRDADIVWFPWLHRHRLPAAPSPRVIGTFHDAIMLTRADILGPDLRADELETTRRWFAASSPIVVTSDVTRDTVRQLLNLPDRRDVEIIPVGFDHLQPTASRAALPEAWAWADRPFVLFPANIMPHKNHECLFDAWAQLDRKLPVVLTGSGTLLSEGARAAALRARAEERGLEVGTTLQPLGLIDDRLYSELLARASALVMPTLAEGGGSFPVLEAMMRGVPVLCSDIPVLREQVRRFGGAVGWFDPHDPRTLARQMDDLTGDYERRRAEAATQRSAIKVRRWREVAQDYLALFRQAARAVRG